MMRVQTVWVTALLLFFSVSLTAAGNFPAALQEKQAQAEEQEQPEKEIPPEDLPFVIPEQAKKKKNPLPPTRESIETGRELFQSQCRMCHGAAGKGNGDLAEQLDFSMPDFTRPETQKERTDGELYYIIVQGHGRMPGQGKRLTSTMKWNMVNYIRTLDDQAEADERSE